MLPGGGRFVFPLLPKHDCPLAGTNNKPVTVAQHRAISNSIGKPIILAYGINQKTDRGLRIHPRTHVGALNESLHEPDVGALNESLHEPYTIPIYAGGLSASSQVPRLTRLAGGQSMLSDFRRFLLVVLHEHWPPYRRTNRNPDRHDEGADHGRTSAFLHQWE